MFSISKINGQFNSTQIKEYICDYLSDLSKLPTSETKGSQQDDSSVVNNNCSVGSEAYVIENSSRYILGNDNKWHLKKASSGSDSGEITESNVATDEEVDAMLHDVFSV